MATKKMPLAALQAPCAYKRNKYRNLAIEYYARNSSSVLALTMSDGHKEPGSLSRN